MTERMSLLKSIKDLFVRLDENHGQQIAKITRDFSFLKIAKFTANSRHQATYEF